MIEVQEDRSGQFPAGITDKERDARLLGSLHSVIATSFDWEVESDKFVRHFSKEPALPVNHNLNESLTHVRTVVHPNDLNSFDAAFDLLLASSNQYHNLFRVIRPDRTIVWLEEWGQLERHVDGKPCRGHFKTRICNKYDGRQFALN
jgi:PAS fold